MNTERMMAEVGRLEEILRLIQDAQRLAAKPAERWRLVSELVTVEARLERLRHWMLESALVEVLWQYTDGAGGKTVAAAKELLVLLAAAKED
jgi:hypothetical protein